MTTMLATIVNKVTCCWGDCHQAGTELVTHEGVVLEYCVTHVDRAIHREEARRAKRKIPILRK